MCQKRAVKGRIAQVDICPEEAGYVLSVGPVSLWLQLDEAQDVLSTLKRALGIDAEAAGIDAEVADAHRADEPDLTPLLERVVPPRSN
jgi:hypothetical protein